MCAIRLTKGSKCERGQTGESASSGSEENKKLLTAHQQAFSYWTPSFSSFHCMQEPPSRRDKRRTRWRWRPRPQSRCWSGSSRRRGGPPAPLGSPRSARRGRGPPQPGSLPPVSSSSEEFATKRLEARWHWPALEKRHIVRWRFISCFPGRHYFTHHNLFNLSIVMMHIQISHLDQIIMFAFIL